MCILSYLRPGVPVDEDGLLNGGLSNPDGHGWAITDQANGTIRIGKSMDLLDALDSFITAREELPRGHALFHSRWATHGKLDTSNVHPFVAGHSEQTVVAHNGILPSAAHPAKGDPRSDTRLFADEILSTRYRRLNRDRVREALANWITDRNKLVILTVDPRYRHNAYLINSKMGTWDTDSGIWHSNYDYESTPRWLGTWSSSTKGGVTNYWKSPAALGYNSTTKRWEEDKTPRQTALELRAGVAEVIEARDLERCVYCQETVNAAQVCIACGTCQDCLEDERDCQCFQKLVNDANRKRQDDEAEYQSWLEGNRTWGSDDLPIVST